MNWTHNITHLAVIPDGNRRWAKQKGLPEIEGHRVGADKTLPDLFDTIVELGIKYFTFWALSPENFVKRSKFEMDNLMRLTRYFLEKRTKELHARNIKILVIGDIEALPEDIQKMIDQAKKVTENNTGLVAIFAINYGGRNEMIRAIQKMNNDNIKIQDLTKEEISQNLDTAGIPDPDLIIRTGGEKRTSGFMLWQSEYAEYAFLETLFPDFSPEKLRECVEDYAQRQRRFGK
jgi:undecaprenyl diphosphate synthase